ncbi:NEDD4-binding protein [Acrasis kona]|uniref:NEDD4-binding protein n=1 Tax=Acrasis kona TaxID=1008807 RepID=A0AAW2Z7Y0_9EUKA
MHKKQRSLQILLDEFKGLIDDDVINLVYNENNGNLDWSLQQLGSIIQTAKKEEVSIHDEEHQENIDFLYCMFKRDNEDPYFDREFYEEKKMDVSKTLNALLRAIETESEETNDAQVLGSMYNQPLETKSISKEDFEEMLNLQNSLPNALIKIQPSQPSGPKPKKNQKNDDKKKQLEKEQQEKIHNLKEFCPTAEIAVIKFILKECDWDVQRAFQQIEGNAPQKAIQSPNNKPKKPKGRKFKPAPELFGAANGHVANRWIETKPQAIDYGTLTASGSESTPLEAQVTKNKDMNSLSSRIKIDKLKNMISGCGLPDSVLEDIFEQSGHTVSATISQLKKMYPDVVFKSKQENNNNENIVNTTQSTLSNQASSKVRRVQTAYYHSDESKAQSARAMAHDYCCVRNQFFQLALEAYRRGDGARAREFSERGREADRASKESHREAAEHTFAVVNKDRFGQRTTDILTIDLHGLHVKESLDKLELFLDEMIYCDQSQKSKSNRMNVITGMGKHSHGGYSRIKPAVIQYLKDRDYRFSESVPGVIQIRLKPSQISQYDK